MLTESINIHYNFNGIHSKNKKGSVKLDELLIYELMNLHNQKWQHIGCKEQFKSLRGNLFKQLIQIVLQAHIKMIEVMNFFMAILFPFKCSKRF